MSKERRQLVKFEHRMVPNINRQMWVASRVWPVRDSVEFKYEEIAFDLYSDAEEYARDEWGYKPPWSLGVWLLLLILVVIITLSILILTLSDSWSLT